MTTSIETVKHFVWNMDPEIINFGDMGIRWYGLLFAIGFLCGLQIMSWIYKREGKSLKDLDSLFVYMIFGTVIGARLGHCLFYQPAEYLAEPLEILKVWHGGLASHGAVIGILLAVFLFSRRRKNQPYWWVISRLTIAISLAAVFIRTGNFFNSEIVGIPSDLPWAVIFLRYDHGQMIARHPVQLYEALSYLCIFFIMLYTYLKCGKNTRPALLIGEFFTLVFSVRYFLEFFKEVQVDLESTMTIHIGQLLSLPMILFGLFMLWYAFDKRHIPYSSITDKK